MPVPAMQRGRVLVRTVASLISAGTERAAIEQASQSLAQKARERPDLVKTLLERVRSDGVLPTLGAVRDKLSASQALGYSAAGIVIEVGNDVREFTVGDRVACAGVGFASHAEAISVPQNLCVRLPDKVDFEAGAFGTLGAIALQGVRLAEPTLGEAVVVIGLGLVGQLAVQLLTANGCRVFGIDLDQNKIALANELGAEAGSVSNDDTKDTVLRWTRSRGADAVLITAATDSNQPLELAGEISRVKGRVVVVGTTGLEVPRQTFYARELALKISMSYGPGRYDPEYEERGHDYPFGHVRWTAQRNIEAFLDLVASGRINFTRLISHRFSIEQAEHGYDLISGKRDESYLGVLLQYDPDTELKREIKIRERPAASSLTDESVRIGLIGAGDYVRKMLLPHFKDAGAEFCSIATASGVSARDVGNRFAFARAVSDAEVVIGDEEVNLVVIGTRHDLHSELARKVLESGKNAFVEKPLALSDDELDHLLKVAAASQSRLMVGFNRRFSPLAVKAKEFFSDRRAPLSILYRINAGQVSKNHWVQDAKEGGGRIVGEVCHFIDLMQFWTDAPPVNVFAEAIAGNNPELVNEDSVFITLRFADGSNGSIAYLAEGDKGLAKERVEIFCEGRVFVLDDFRNASLYLNSREEKLKLGRQDKGQAKYVQEVCDLIRHGGAAPITLGELAATTRTTFRILDSLRTRESVKV